MTAWPHGCLACLGKCCTAGAQHSDAPPLKTASLQTLRWPSPLTTHAHGSSSIVLPTISMFRAQELALLTDFLGFSLCNSNVKASCSNNKPLGLVPYLHTTHSTPCQSVNRWLDLVTPQVVTGRRSPICPVAKTSPWIWPPTPTACVALTAATLSCHRYEHVSFCVCHAPPRLPRKDGDADELH